MWTLNTMKTRQLLTKYYAWRRTDKYGRTWWRPVWGTDGPNSKENKENLLLLLLLLLSGATAQRGPQSSHSWGFYITHIDTLQSVGPSGRGISSSYLTTHKSRKRQTSMPSAGFEPAASASEQLRTLALDRAAIGIGKLAEPTNVWSWTDDARRETRMYMQHVFGTASQRNQPPFLPLRRRAMAHVASQAPIVSNRLWIWRSDNQTKQKDARVFVQDLDTPALYISGRNATQPQEQNVEVFHPRELAGNSDCVTRPRGWETWRIAALRKSFFFFRSGAGSVTIRVLHHTHVTKPFRPATALGSDCGAIHSSRNRISKGDMLLSLFLAFILFSYLLSFPQIIVWIVKLLRRWTIQ